MNYHFFRAMVMVPYKRARTQTLLLGNQHMEDKELQQMCPANTLDA